MPAAPSPTFDIPSEIGDIFGRFVAAEFAYLTPKGEPLCWPITPYWYPERGVLAIATGLAYPTKADYPKLNSKVAMLFSDPTSSGLHDPPRVMVQGHARVLDEDLQANTDRYVVELRRKFPVARFGLNSLSVKLLDFYLPRLWVEITPLRIAVYRSNSAPEVLGAPLNNPADTSSEETRATPLSGEEVKALRDMAEGSKTAVVTTLDRDGFPFPIRTEVIPSLSGSVSLTSCHAGGSASLTFHRHTFGGTRFQAHMARGRVVKEDERWVFAARRLVGFFGNGVIFPFSVLPEVASLRRRLRSELKKRGKSMPDLRIP